MIRVFAEGALWFVGLAGVGLLLGFFGSLVLERLQDLADRKRRKSWRRDL